jgi:hypothetical protein
LVGGCNQAIGSRACSRRERLGIIGTPRHTEE